MSFSSATKSASAGGGGGSSKAAAAAAAVAATTTALTRRLETFSGTGGALPESSLPSVPVTQEALLRESFVFHAELSKLHTDLCKAWEQKGAGGNAKVVPWVSPSVEQFGAVVGMQLEEHEPLRSARELALDAEEGGASTQPTMQQQRGFLPPQPLRDRNAYLPYRWMFSPLHERSAALRDRLEEMVTALGSAAPLPLESMTVGRICAEAEASKLSNASVSLELARGSGGGGGGIMRLDLREVPRFAVFPGQVVGVQGASTAADRLAVSDLATSAAAPYARMPIANAVALAKVRGKGGPTRVWVAAGPFTDPKDFQFEPLHNFLAEAIAAEPPPNVIVLQGPFVDMDHPMVKSTAPVDDKGEQSTYMEVWESSTFLHARFSLSFSPLPMLRTCTRTWRQPSPQTRTQIPPPTRTHNPSTPPHRQC
jgi:hypothetical protein